MKKTLKDVERFGDSGDYESQAQSFLEATNTKLSIYYIDTSKHFTGEDDIRDRYTVQLEKDSRKYVFTFGDGLVNTWKRYTKHVNAIDQRGSDEATFKYNFNKLKTVPGWRRENERLNRGEVQGITPSAYDVLAGLQAYEPPRTFDDFIAEYGYTIDSKTSYENAQKTFDAVNKEYEALRALYSDDELQALASIQ